MSGYLLTIHLGPDAALPGQIDICRAIFGSSCDEAIRGPIAVQLGIPLAGWGIIYFVTVAALLTMGRLLGDAFRDEALLGALALVSLGTGASVLLTALMLFGAAPFCGICAAIHVANLALCAMLWTLNRIRGNSLVDGMTAGIRYLLGRQSQDTLDAHWKTNGFFTAALVAVVAYQWVLIQTDRHARGTDGNPQEMIAEYEANAVREIPFNAAEDPYRGPPDARLQLVVFSSFRCPGCKAFAHVMSHLTEDYGNDLTVIFKHFPLSTACNPEIAIDKHPGSCAELNVPAGFGQHVLAAAVVVNAINVQPDLSAVWTTMSPGSHRQLWLVGVGFPARDLSQRQPGLQARQAR